jgi:hypothetical protein
MAFPDDWNYYKEYEQPGTADGELTDYQVDITVEYVPGKMLSDYGDVRFTLEDNTELDYHLVSYDASNALFVVKIPTLATTGITLRVWYGYSSAMTTSNPEQVYSSYDDFNDNEINTSLWTTSTPVGTITESNGKLNIVIAAGQRAGMWTAAGSDKRAPIITQSVPSGDFKAKVKIEDGTVNANTQRGILLFLDRNNLYLFGHRHDGTRKIQVYKIVNNVGNDAIASVTSSTLPLWVQIRKEGSTYYFEYSTDDIGYTVLYSTSSLGFTPSSIGLAATNWNPWNANSSSFNDFIARKTTANPPGIGSWGEEKEIGVDLTGQQLQGAGYINPVTLQNILELNPLEMEASINPLTVKRIIEMAELEASAEINPMILQSLLKTSCTIKQPQSVKVKHKIS